MKKLLIIITAILGIAVFTFFLLAIWSKQYTEEYKNTGFLLGIPFLGFLMFTFAYIENENWK